MCITKRGLVIGLFLLSFFLVSCQLFNFPTLQQQQQQNAPQAQELPQPPQPTLPPQQELPVEEVQEQQVVGEACTFSADCSAEKECISGLCRTLQEFYGPMEKASSSLCEKKCSIKKVALKTSDGEEYALTPGQGSYSYAGALEWKILSSPQQCQDVNTIIPFKFISKNTGNILGEEIVTVAVGQKSKVVKHPTISRVAFTVEVLDVEKSCE